MNRTFTFVLAIAVSVGTTAMLDLNRRPRAQAADAQLASDGAFRDGLYLGHLAASELRPMRSPIGRWSTEKDRLSFDAGYRRGYSSFANAAIHE